MSYLNKNYAQALREIKKGSPDVALVLKLLNQAIDEGCPESAYALATWHLFGKYVEKDWTKAVFLLKKASLMKHPGAMYDLAICYEEGKGIKENKAEAFRLYLQAALRGDEQSVCEVGRCYYYGIGIDEDRELAELWYERADELGVD